MKGAFVAWLGRPPPMDEYHCRRFMCRGLGREDVELNPELLRDQQRRGRVFRLGALSRLGVEPSRSKNPSQSFGQS